MHILSNKYIFGMPKRLQLKTFKIIPPRTFERMARGFSFYSFPGYEFLILTITFFDVNNLIVNINN